MKLNKSDVYKNFFETVVDSTEWAFDVTTINYASYIEGLTDMTNKLVDFIDKNMNMKK